MTEEFEEQAFDEEAGKNADQRKKAIAKPRREASEEIGRVTLDE